MAAELEADRIDPADYTILVVDDLEANRALLARRLEKFGYGVDSVDSGPAALAYIEDRPPDIVLLDYMMPQMNGVEVLQRLRSGNPETANLPVIIVTARAEGETAIDALAAGADDYVTKPMNFDVLHARIKSQLAKQGGTARLRRMNAVLDERMTLRSMALADLEGELAEETRRRRELEGRLAEGSAAAEAAAAGTVGLAPLLDTIAQRFEAIYGNTMSGRVPNLAQMTELKTLIADAVKLAGSR